MSTPYGYRPCFNHFKEHLHDLECMECPDYTECYLLMIEQNKLEGHNDNRASIE